MKILQYIKYFSLLISCFLICTMLPLILTPNPDFGFKPGIICFLLFVFLGSTTIIEIIKED